MSAPRTDLHAVATRDVRTFVAAEVPAAPERSSPSSRAAVRFRVCDLDTGACRELPADPTVARPIEPGRLTVSAAATFVLIMGAGLAVMATAPLLLGYSPVVVTSGSMQPAIVVGDVVVTADSDGEGLEKGAVINFSTPDGDRLHRVVEVTGLGYRTSGDANRSSDSELVTPSRVLGTGFVVVPFAGLPRVWMDLHQWPQLLLIAAVLTACVYVSRTGWIEPNGHSWT